MNDPAADLPTPSDAPAFDFGKRRALLMSLALIGAVLWPIQQNWRAKPIDNFPLSYYPMFSTKRDKVEIFYYLVGRDGQGSRRYIPYRWIGDGGGNQVRRQLRRMMNEGHAPELARTVAKRVARKDDPLWSQVATVQVIKGKYSVDDFFHGKKDPISEQIYGTAQVERRTL